MQGSANKQEVLIVAGEASSAVYATRLLELWKAENPEVHAFGVGSKEMKALGFECLGSSEKMAVMGLQEVFVQWRLIKSVFNKLVEETKKRRPKFVLLLDYPGFNLRLAKKIKALGIPVIYYISPKVWAWNTGRVKQIKKYVDRMLVLFPFEVDFYKKYGVDVDLVGHPILDELKDDFFSKDYFHKQRARYGVSPSDTLVGIMPGSRELEIKLNLRVQLDVAQKMYDKNPNLKFALFVAPSFEANKFQELLSGYKFPLIVVKDNPFEMINLADVVLAVSGTALLLVGLLEKPMVMMYKLSAVTASLLKPIFFGFKPFGIPIFSGKNMKHYGLINIILGKEVVKEFIHTDANVQNIYAAMEELVSDSKARENIKSELKKIRPLLGERGATGRVHKILEEYFL